MDRNIKSQSLESNLTAHTLQDNEAGCGFPNHAHSGLLSHGGDETVERRIIIRLKRVIVIIMREDCDWFLIIFLVSHNRIEKWLCTEGLTEAQVLIFVVWQLFATHLLGLSRLMSLKGGKNNSQCDRVHWAKLSKHLKPVCLTILEFVCCRAGVRLGKPPISAQCQTLLWLYVLTLSAAVFCPEVRLDASTDGNNVMLKMDFLMCKQLSQCKQC